MPKYIYKGVEVEPIPGQQFSSHWNVWYDEPTEHDGKKRVKVSVVVGKDLEVLEDGAVINLIPDITNAASPMDAFNINLGTFSSIRVALPGIGRTAARHLIKNRPADGYKDFEDIISLNSEDCKGLNWEEIKEVISFE